jgi:4-amino-4-deoxy-L-arabinose transferase-like glycosyltransferase
MTIAAGISKQVRPGTFLSVAAAVFLLAVCARVAFFAARGVTTAPDSVDYARLAENLRAHGAFSLDTDLPLMPTIRRAPLYPVFLAAFVSSGSVSLVAATVAQAIIDAGVAVLIILLASAIVNLRWAVISGLVYALYPGSIYFTTTILSETLFTALLTVGVVLVLYGFRSNRLTLTALPGVAFGLAILCRPIAFPLPFLLIGVSLFATRQPRGWVRAVVLAATMALVVSPWLIRCVRVSGHFVFVQGFTQTIFYVGTRTDWDQKDQAGLWSRFATEDPYGRRLSAARTPAEVVEADRFGLSLALQNIRANPGGYLTLRIRSFPYLFITSFDMFTGMNKSFGQSLRERDVLGLALKLSLLLIFSLAPFVLAGVGIVSARHNLAAMLCATVWLYTLLINFPVWVEYRYWLPAVPFLLVSAAPGAQRIAAWFTARKNTSQG